MDIYTVDKRSSIMASIRGIHTKPELKVRRLIHSMGFRYILHDRRITGTPDIYFPRKRKAIFVHGCFWHRHSCKNGQSTPQSNVSFWEKKFSNTMIRDVRNQRELEDDGIDVLLVWECETRPAGNLSLKESLFNFITNSGTD